MSVNTNPDIRGQSTLLSVSTGLHPDYIYWAPTWKKIRDAEIGELEVKKKQQEYLPKLQGHDAGQYRAYLHRAVFFNMTAKTLNALYGTMFRRNPKVTGLSRRELDRTRQMCKDGTSLHIMAKNAVKEVLTVGRYGMLVDADPSGRGGAYVACYTTENILDWETSEVDGHIKLTRVCLREVYRDKGGSFGTHRYRAKYRVLVLELTSDGWAYSQHIYNDEGLNMTPDEDRVPDNIITPTVRGNPMSEIPFIMVGPFSNTTDVQKPPLLDIVTLNFSHYESYAQLEQGRFYTANPVYYTTTSNTGDDVEYYVGPDVVWELGADGKAGVIEFTGNGLKFLENALTMKEAQISAIGGRMMPGSAAGAAESDNSLRLKEQNEQTLLVNIADTLDEGITTVLRWWADWNNISREAILRISFEVNRDFLLKDIGAREFRAIHSMYSDGVLPLDAVYDYLRKAEVIPDWMDAEEYKALLKDSKQFPNMVDVLARMKNFPDAETFYEYRQAREERFSFEVSPDPIGDDT